LQKFIRVAVNLYLEENGLEFTGTGVRPKEQSNAPAPEPLGIQPIAPVAPEYVEMPYDPPILIYDQNHKNLKFYAENRLKPYNAEYTRRTGNLPPQECRDLSNVEAILSYVRWPDLPKRWKSL
jgi:hypothetical protein